MLSQKAKYALKAMLALAAQPAGELLQAQDIANRQNVPKKFLDLILIDLKRNGLVHSHRGKHGGYVLGRPAETITFAQVIRIIDGPLAPIPCASLTGYRRCADCKDEKACGVRIVMREVRDAVASILDATTLSSLSGGQLVDALPVETKPAAGKPARKRVVKKVVAAS
ncbi:MAG: Rrf2 family transcriptional regulator [Parvibaculum sp.]|nr:Rrf2 family transcriptional regulator [Parvibaculum sp.]